MKLGRDEVKAAYDRIHAGGRMRAVPGYFGWLLAKLGQRAQGEERRRLLDVGCGTGMMIREAAGRGFEVAGLDISEEGVRQARELVPSAELHVGVAEELPFADASFDVVTCVGSLEHVAKPDKAVRQMARVVKPDGELLVIVPNSRYLMQWVTWIRQAFFPGSSQPVERAASRREWEGLFQENGLSVVRVHKDNNVYLPTRLLQALGRVAGWLVPLAACYQLVFVLRPRARG
jgi:2-polyprenyl-3-methyl-5-hydroxy-6-metoxy-1,4-benzoquinol methylase